MIAVYYTNRIYKKIPDCDCFPGTYLSHNWRVMTWVSNYRGSDLNFCYWIPTWFSLQLCALWWLPSQCSLHFSKLRKSATDVFVSPTPTLHPVTPIGATYLHLIRSSISYPRLSMFIALTHCCAHSCIIDLSTLGVDYLPTYQRRSIIKYIPTVHHTCFQDNC